MNQYCPGRVRRVQLKSESVSKKTLLKYDASNSDEESEYDFRLPAAVTSTPMVANVSRIMIVMRERRNEDEGAEGWRGINVSNED